MVASRFGKRLSGPLVVLSVFSIVSNLLLLVMPIYLTQIYDRVIPTQSAETLAFLSLIAISALLLLGLIEMLRQTVARRLSARFELAILPRLISASSHGEASLNGATVGKVATVKRFISSPTFVNLFDLPFAPLFLILMFFAHPLLGWATCGGIVVLLGVAMFNDLATRKSSADFMEAQGKAARRAQETLSAREDVRALGMGSALSQRWTSQALNAALSQERAGIVNDRFFGLTRFVRQGLQIGTLGLGAWLVINGDMSASLIFAASIVSSRALLPIQQIVGGWKAISEARRSYRDVNEALQEAEKAEDSNTKVNLPRPDGRLSARKLHYAVGQSSDAPILVNAIDFDAEPGSLTVIVGASGSGKSTFLRLLCGAISSTSGEVRLDSFRLAEWPSETRGKAFGYMAQQTTLFEGTVAENIARFTSDCDDSMIIEAAKRAQAHDFISTLPEGYNTHVGPNGIRLSGGQTQRIALARALFAGPSVLVLDEPNANLDSHGEQALKEALDAERKNGTTVILVTHRNSLLTIADQVLIMENGQIRPTQLPHSQSNRGQSRVIAMKPSATTNASGSV
nr:type I secretion system permease/ATPase [uncultured Cohaesibacter sp.]